MTGKGPGQDATINPFYDQDCYAVIENLGKRVFSARIQQKGKIVENIIVLKGETMRIKLFKGNELYLDSNSKGKVRAKVSYERIEE